MNRRVLFVVLAVILAGVLVSTLAARMTSGGGEVIARDVVAGGGGRGVVPSGHGLETTIAQPAAQLSTAPNGTILVGGYQTMVPRVPSTVARLWRLY